MSVNPPSAGAGRVPARRRRSRVGGVVVLIDPPAWPAHGRLWSHLVSDTSLAELHAFADATGVPRRGFEGDHYDVPASRYDDLVAAGALPVPGRELLRRLVAAGLRVPKLRGERVLASSEDAGWARRAGAHRLDVVVSPHPTPEAATVSARVLATDRAGRLLLVAAPDGGWELPGSDRRDGEPVSRAAARALVDVAVGADAAALERALEPVGYERIRLLGDPPPGWNRPSPRSYDAVLALPDDAAPPVADDVAARWLPPATARTEAGSRSWWPLAARLLGEDAP